MATPKDVPKRPLEITVFRDFSIRVGNAHILETDEKADKIWHLLQLLIVNRHAPLSNEALIRKIWRSHPSAQPEGALKNLVYRLRKMLQEHGILNGKDLIQYSNQGYHWNNQFSCLIDCELMEAHYTAGIRYRGNSKRAESEFTEAMQYYRGYFLSERQNDPWTEPFRVYYHQIFLNTAHELMKILEEKKQYMASEILGMFVLRIDRYAERMHRHIIYSLLKQNKAEQALAHYHYASNLYLQRGQEHLPPSMVAMYHELLDYVEEEDILRFHEIQDGEGAAFFCDYDTLTHLYLNETRAALRFYQTIFLIAFSVDFTGSQEHLREPSITKAMDVLFRVLQHALQDDDIYCKTSNTRFLILMGKGDFAHAQQLGKKVTNRFRYLHRSPSIELSLDIQELEPY